MALYEFSGAGSFWLGAGSPFYFTGSASFVFEGASHFSAAFNTTSPTTDESLEGGILMRGFAVLDPGIPVDDPDDTEWEVEQDFSAMLTGVTFESEDESDDTDLTLPDEPEEETYLVDEFILDVDEPEEEEIS